MARSTGTCWRTLREMNSACSHGTKSDNAGEACRAADTRSYGRSGFTLVSAAATYVHVSCLALHRLQPMQTVRNLRTCRFRRLGPGPESGRMFAPRFNAQPVDGTDE